MASTKRALDRKAIVCKCNEIKLTQNIADMNTYENCHKVNKANRNPLLIAFACRCTRVTVIN